MPDPMPDPRNKELVSEEALRGGTSDQDSQDSKSHNSQKQKQVASDDDGGTGGDGVGSSSSGSSSQSSSTSPDPDELPDSASSLQPDEPVNMGQGSSASNEETPATETSEDAAVSGSTQQLTISLFEQTHSDRTRDQLVGEAPERATVPSSFSSTSPDPDELPDSASSLQPDEPVNMGQGSSASNEETPATETSEDAAVSGSTQQLTISLFEQTHSDRTRDQLVGEAPERATVPSSFSPSIRRGPANGQDAGSDPADEMKKLEPMAELPPINGNFYPDGGPGIQGANINNGMLMPRYWNGDMVDGSKQPIWVIASPVLNLSPTGGINPFGDVYVSKADDVSMALFYGEDVPQEP